MIPRLSILGLLLGPRVEATCDAPTRLVLGAMANGDIKSSLAGTFGRFATRVSHWVGTSWVFLIALALVVAWGATGPMFKFSNTWQLVINTATTIVTFLMVFLIQNTQNRDARAIHLKLDEIIRSITHAHNDMIDIEKLSDEELESLAKTYESLRAEAERRRKGPKKKVPA